MKLFKTVLLATILSLFLVGASNAQDTNTKLRGYIGGGIVTGSETDFSISDQSVVATGGVYFPSSIIPGFYSFAGFIYNRANPKFPNPDITGNNEIRTLDVQYRLLYYFSFSESKLGAFAVLGPDYKNIENPDPLEFNGSILQAATGFGGYWAPGAGNNRISLTIERDILGPIEYREWRFLAGWSFPLNLKS